MHEIVTLQVGERANYVATHFWNLQESYFTYGSDEESPVDHDVHFRPGVAADGTDTYTPRALIYDFKKSYGTLRKINDLYDTGPDDGTAKTWAGDLMSHKQPLIEANAYQQNLNAGLETSQLTSDQVRYWSDFNRVYFNPRSIVQLHETDLNPGQRAFNDWSHGDDLFDTIQRDRDVFDDELRHLIEECDQMQGMQLFTTVDDGWGSFSRCYTERLADELGKTPVWIWGLSSSVRDEHRMRRLINEARSLSYLTEHAALYVPVKDVPSNTLQGHTDIAKSLWLSSALQVIGIESTLLPSRFRAAYGERLHRMEELGTTLNLNGDQNIAELSFDSTPKLLDHSSNGHVDDDDDDGGVQPGRWNIGYEMSINVAAGEMDKMFGEVAINRHADEAESNGVAESSEEVRTQRFQTSLQFPLLDSFPEVFGNAKAGSSATVTARLATSSRTGKWIEAIESTTRRLIPVEERENLTNRLLELKHAFRASDYDDDDDWDI